MDRAKKPKKCVPILPKCSGTTSRRLVLPTCQHLKKNTSKKGKIGQNSSSDEDKSVEASDLVADYLKTLPNAGHNDDEGKLVDGGFWTRPGVSDLPHKFKKKSKSKLVNQVTKQDSPYLVDGPKLVQTIFKDDQISMVHGANVQMRNQSNFNKDFTPEMSKNSQVQLVSTKPKDIFPETNRNMEKHDGASMVYRSSTRKSRSSRKKSKNQTAKRDLTPHCTSSKIGSFADHIIMDKLDSDLPTYGASKFVTTKDGMFMVESNSSDDYTNMSKNIDLNCNIAVDKFGTNSGCGRMLSTSDLPQLVGSKLCNNGEKFLTDPIHSKKLYFDRRRYLDLNYDLPRRVDCCITDGNLVTSSASHKKINDAPKVINTDQEDEVQITKPKDFAPQYAQISSKPQKINPVPPEASKDDDRSSPTTRCGLKTIFGCCPKRKAKKVIPVNEYSTSTQMRRSRSLLDFVQTSIVTQPEETPRMYANSLADEAEIVTDQEPINLVLDQSNSMKTLDHKSLLARDDRSLNSLQDMLDFETPNVPEYAQILPNSFRNVGQNLKFGILNSKIRGW